MSLVGESSAWKIAFSEEQAQLLEVAAAFCREKSPIEKVRALMTEEEGFDKSLWGEIASLGWLGVAAPESYGGSGLSLAEAIVLAEPMGRRLFASPFFTTTLAAQMLIRAGTETQKKRWLPKICEGTIATLALHEPHGDWDLTNITARAEEREGGLHLIGEKRFVLDAAAAEMILVSVLHKDAPACVIVEKAALPKAALSRETVIDETKRSYRLKLDGITADCQSLLSAEKMTDALRHVHLAAILLLSAEMCGGLSGALDLTVEYLNTRRQFDRFIGSYQALKHPTVDMLTGWDMARSHLYYAASLFGKMAAADDAEAAVRMAKASASDAFAFGSDRCIQFHGGMGFTYECDAQLYRRRALWGEYMHGDSAWHRAHLADILLK